MERGKEEIRKYGIAAPTHATKRPNMNCAMIKPTGVRVLMRAYAGMAQINRPIFAIRISFTAPLSQPEATQPIGKNIIIASVNMTVLIERP